jgi:hypothetical protein
VRVCPVCGIEEVFDPSLFCDDESIFRCRECRSGARVNREAKKPGPEWKFKDRSHLLHKKNKRDSLDDRAWMRAMAKLGRPLKILNKPVMGGPDHE